MSCLRKGPKGYRNNFILKRRNNFILKISIDKSGVGEVDRDSFYPNSSLSIYYRIEFTTNVGQEKWKGFLNRTIDSFLLNEIDFKLSYLIYYPKIPVLLTT